LDVVLRGLSMTRGDDEVIAMTGSIFDGLYEYHRRAPCWDGNPHDRRHGGRPGQLRDPATGAAGPLPGYFTGRGTWGFGGPIASVRYMRRDALLIETALRTVLASRPPSAWPAAARVSPAPNSLW
jgi:hypothetical protein